MTKKRLLRFARNDTMLLFVFILIFGMSSYVFAEGQKTERLTGKKQIQGEVSGISKNTISVVYRTDASTGTEYEMLLPFEDNIALGHRASIKEFQVGDTVRIDYDELVESDGTENKAKRKAQKIDFVKSNPPKQAEETEEE